MKTAAAGMLMLFLCVSAGLANPLDHIRFPDTMRVGEETLALNGVGVRRVFLMEPYVAGLYVKRPYTSGISAIRADERMGLRLHMAEPMGSHIMSRSVFNGMLDAVVFLGVDFPELEERIRELTGFFQEDLNKGDKFDFHYLPGQGVEVIKNGRRLGLIYGLDFKAVFFGAWLNDEKPIDIYLQQALLAGAAPAPEPAGHAAASVAPAIIDTRDVEPVAKPVAKPDMETPDIAHEPAPLAYIPETPDVSAAVSEIPVVKARFSHKKSIPLVQPARERETHHPPVFETPIVAEMSTFSVNPLYFSSDADTLTVDAEQVLDALAVWMRAHPHAEIRIDVYAGPGRSAWYSRVLSESRAENTLDYLQQSGIDTRRVKTRFHGSSPANPDHRIEFSVLQTD